MVANGLPSYGGAGLIFQLNLLQEVSSRCPFPFHFDPSFMHCLSLLLPCDTWLLVSGCPAPTYCNDRRGCELANLQHQCHTAVLDDAGRRPQSTPSTLVELALCSQISNFVTLTTATLNNLPNGVQQIANAFPDLDINDGTLMLEGLARK